VLPSKERDRLAVQQPCARILYTDADPDRRIKPARLEALPHRSGIWSSKDKLVVLAATQRLRERAPFSDGNVIQGEAHSRGFYEMGQISA
jgi:hypothetical protein